MKPIPSLFLLTGLLPGMMMAQAPAPTTAPVQVPTVVRDAYQGAWDAPASTGEARKEVVAEDAKAIGSQQVGLDGFRQQRNAALIRGRGELDADDRAVLLEQFKALEAQDPNGFDTHMAGYYLHFPTLEAFRHLDQAAARDGGRRELIAPRLVNAVRLGDRDGFERWGKALKERDQVAPGLFAAAKDLLLSVDRDAVLITAGEMDAYPTWALQAAGQERRDVLVVDERLLSDPAYRQRVWQDARCNGPVPASDRALMAALPSASPRPIFLSMALGQRIDASWAAQLYVTGIAFRFSSTPVDNIPALELRWVDLRKPMDAGPLSSNYLVPASVLLKHYRSVGDEAGVARMERSLRAMAQQLKASSALYRTGVLQH